ncbi:MAG: hypothetical protein PUC53_08300 [Bacteroidales bacterium]|nr:hypothetical protein [Bacteroidales bacterium]
MKAIKILLSALFLFGCFYLSAKDSVPEVIESPSISVSASSDYPMLVCSGVLNSSLPYTQPICLGSGTFGVLYYFTGNDTGHLYTLYVDSSNEGHCAYVDYTGTQNGVSLSGNNIVQLSIDDDTANCCWYIYKFSD